MDALGPAAASRAVLPAATWDFIEGGAGDERSVAGNLDAFERIRLRPRMLRGVAATAPGRTVFGQAWAAPIGVAAMAYHGLAHPDGEVATAAAAARAGLPIVVSMMAGRTLEDVAAAGGPRWLQLYPLVDREATADLVARAVTAGYSAIVLTLDAPRLGVRPRDRRSGFRLPDGLKPANLERYGAGTDAADPAAHAVGAFDSGVDWSYVTWLSGLSGLPLVVKGVLRADDAVLAVAAGARGVIVSNHGGRQLDGAVATIDALPEVVAAVGRAVPVFLDGGVRRGSDVCAALALGATAVFVGRPVLHALATGGPDGVHGLLSDLVDDYATALLLSGAAGPDGLDRSLVAGAVPDGADLDARTLHGSVTDPVLDTMTFLNEIGSQFPDAVSFAPGRPYDADFSLDEVLDDIRAYTAHRGDPEIEGRKLLQYGPTAGVIGDLLADLVATDGITADAASIVVTVGAQEGMVLALRALFASRDDVLAVPRSCYVGITGAARLLDIDVVPVDEAPDGLVAEDLDRVVAEQRLLGRRVRACYVVPDAANPSGATMTVGRRHALLTAAARHDLYVIEDSPYRVYAGTDAPPLKAIDSRRRVVHLGSFAKTAYPGLRLGYVIADQKVARPDGSIGPLAEELTKIRSMITVSPPGIAQAAIGGFLLRHANRLDKANLTARARYAENLDRIVDTLADCFPADLRDRLGVDWTRPTGGFFMTVRVGFRADEAALRDSARHYGVIWTPMGFFHTDGGGWDRIRLSGSAVTPDRAEDGIRRLARFIIDRSGVTT